MAWSYLFISPWCLSSESLKSKYSYRKHLVFFKYETHHPPDQNNIRPILAAHQTQLSWGARPDIFWSPCSWLRTEPPTLHRYKCAASENFVFEYRIRHIRLLSTKLTTVRALSFSPWWLHRLCHRIKIARVIEAFPLANPSSPLQVRCTRGLRPENEMLVLLNFDFRVTWMP